MDSAQRKKRNREVLEAVVAAIKSVLKPERIVLFGSRASGRNVPGSDFDLAVKGKKPPDSVMCELEAQIDRVRGLYKVDLVFLDEVDREFSQMVKETGSVIYEEKA